MSTKEMLKIILLIYAATLGWFFLVHLFFEEPEDARAYLLDRGIVTCTHSKVVNCGLNLWGCSNGLKFYCLHDQPSMPASL